MDIYVKPKKKVTLTGRDQLLIKDIADVVSTKEVMGKVKHMALFAINNQGAKKQNFLISITDMITTIQKSYPNATITNVGEMDTWVQYMVQPSKDYVGIKWLKIFMVSVILFIGSSTAIMSFHTDGQMPKIFEKYYEIFFGTTNPNPLIINIPYSIGLAVGIIVFYNHFGGKKLTDDPTPIEVEMEKYDQDVTNTMVDAMAQRKERLANEGADHD